MDHLTAIAGVPDKRDAVPGMAYFAGTGPVGKRCESCAHKGYEKRRQVWSEKQNDWVLRASKCGGCAMFFKQSGKHGPNISGDNRACKFFDEKPKDGV